MATTNGTNGTNGTQHAPALDFDTFRNVVNGKLVDTKAHRQGIKPALSEPHYDVPVATEADLDDAVNAGREAFKSWSKTTFEERKAKVLAYADALEAEAEGFAKLLTTEQGKPLAQASQELATAIAWIRGLTTLNVPEEVVEDSKEKRTVVRYTPLGVVGAIVPWNFPILLACGKIAPALLTGNVIIVKPSPFTPYGGLKLAELGQRFFPPGVFQAISGNDSLGPWITSHPGIDKISFTGSSATGKLVMQSASKTLKRVTLELGGNDPAIICGDVDIAKVAPMIAAYSFMNSGQVCLCLKRLYIHESIYEKFREAMVEQIKPLKVGNGFDEGVTHGPIQNSMQYERVKGFFADVEKQGHKVAVGGKIDHGSKGYFINPTIIDNPPDDSRIVVEEPFGPIVPILSWSSEDEVIARANNTKMGLGASVWSSNTETAERIARQLEAGTVWCNTHFDLSPTQPFGGVKESGMGVEWGLQGMKSYCNSQVLVVNKI